MKTMICMIFDRSGSMLGKEDDVVGGCNTFLADQKKLKEPAVIAFVRFDDQGIERFRPMKPLGEVDWLNRAEYQPRGWTPLLDAVGRTVTQLDDDWLREQPERCIVVIFTDGQENASKEYTKAKIKEMIEARQASGKWAFIYLGANVDAFAEAGAMGISPSNTAGYRSTAAGIAAASQTVSASVGLMRSTGKMEAHNLGRNIPEDDPLVQAISGLTPGGSCRPDPKDTATWVPPTTSGTTAWQPPVK